MSTSIECVVADDWKLKTLPIVPLKRCRYSVHMYTVDLKLWYTCVQGNTTPVVLWYGKQMIRAKYD